jgi:hypothetical protein
LTITSDEIELRFRSRWAKGLAKFGSYGTIGRESGLDWVRWRLDEITHVRMASSSAVIRSEAGDCCIAIPFFAPYGKRTWGLIRSKIESIGCPIENVNSNFRAMHSMRRLK